MGLILLPLGIFAGWVAGAAMSRRMVRQEVARLAALMESRNGKSLHPTTVAAPPAPKPAAQMPAEEIAPETILILSAAVAAFLGKRARIRSARQVHVPPSNVWAQQGRVFVQASHNLGLVHTR
jgi:hypothetical protein